MTAVEAKAGWYLMTQAERNAFVATLVRLKIVSSIEAIRLAAPLPTMRLHS